MKDESSKLVSSQWVCKKFPLEAQMGKNAPNPGGVGARFLMSSDLVYTTCCLNNTWKKKLKLRLPVIVTDKAWIKPGTGAEKYAGTGRFITKTDEYTLETC